MLLPDVQATPDSRAVAINRVGVKSVKFPLSIRRADGSEQATVAMIDMYVGLPHHVKGTHMSRFLEVLHANRGALDMAGLRGLMNTMLARLDAKAGYIEMRFTYFIEKLAPVSGVASLLDYEVKMRAEVDQTGHYDAALTVLAPVTSLCPCSKEISEYGAHNQRSHITIEAILNQPMSIEELVAVAEQQASCEVYGLLKRPDEKYVTERAYDNPKFVEDLVRDIALALNGEPRIDAYSIESENFESIHNHSAYALIRQDKRVAR
jgi:GTP cyclohydrolase I